MRRYPFSVTSAWAVHSGTAFGRLLRASRKRSTHCGSGCGVPPATGSSKESSAKAGRQRSSQMSQSTNASSVTCLPAARSAEE